MSCPAAAWLRDHPGAGPRIPRSRTCRSAARHDSFLPGPPPHRRPALAARRPRPLLRSFADPAHGQWRHPAAVDHRRTRCQPSLSACIHPWSRPGHPGRHRDAHPPTPQRPHRRRQHIKTKMIKRQMYGRSGFTLLRYRILLSLRHNSSPPKVPQRRRFDRPCPGRAERRMDRCAAHRPLKPRRLKENSHRR